MVIFVRSPPILVIVLLFGISPLWAVAEEQDETATSGTELSAEPKSYGPVVATDTLADIAIKLKGDGPWHYQRWMYALYQKNPQAFFSDNMNNIKLGARLIVPTEREIEQVDLATAFRAVKVQLYVLKQQRREKHESDEELLLRARMQRLFVSNEMMQQQSGELFDRISVLEQQVGSVVDRVLESEGADVAPAVVPKSVPNSSKANVKPVPVVTPDDENSATWLFILLGVAFVYGAGFVWRRRVEATL
ncbi:MAG TPA: hypothetical protein ENH92_03870 [Ectothiorhodospiraceae bacterium]|nr:hypothetical protein [Ectothiorhodospiraceae bacterium]